MTWILVAFMELASTVSPETVLQSVREKHQLSEDISYTFSQTYVDELRGARPAETGTILVKRDGRFRWAYQAPERKDFIFDGTRAWLYEPGKSQATEFEGFASSAASQALQFLWGRGQLDALFNLDWCNEECPKGEGQKLLELRPKKTLATLDRMVVQIDATTYQILGATSYDAMGNQTVYTLSTPSLGKVHKESWFDFQVPDGVNVIRVNVAGTPVKP